MSTHDITVAAGQTKIQLQLPVIVNLQALKAEEVIKVLTRGQDEDEVQAPPAKKATTGAAQPKVTPKAKAQPTCKKTQAR